VQPPVACQTVNSPKALLARTPSRQNNHHGETIFSTAAIERINVVLAAPSTSATFRTVALASFGVILASLVAPDAFAAVA
jgi:hypothetical protein